MQSYLNKKSMFFSQWAAFENIGPKQNAPTDRV